MVTDPTAPATKRDVSLIMESIGKLYAQVQALEIRTVEWKNDIIRHFDVVAETLDRDLRGAFRDHTSVNTNRFKAHDQRITRLERRTGLVTP